jgi:hypothetical protein
VPAPPDGEVVQISQLGDDDLGRRGRDDAILDDIEDVFRIFRKEFFFPEVGLHDLLETIPSIEGELIPMTMKGNRGLHDLGFVVIEGSRSPGRNAMLMSDRLLEFLSPLLIGIMASQAEQKNIVEPTAILVAVLGEVSPIAIGDNMVMGQVIRDPADNTAVLELLKEIRVTVMPRAFGLEIEANDGRLFRHDVRQAH